MKCPFKVDDLIKGRSGTIYKVVEITENKSYYVVLKTNTTKKQFSNYQGYKLLTKLERALL